MTILGVHRSATISETLLDTLGAAEVVLRKPIVSGVLESISTTIPPLTTHSVVVSMDVLKAGTTTITLAPEQMMDPVPVTPEEAITGQLALMTVVETAAVVVAEAARR